jgi:photosystem II stability/assembly factor-like uncharacterized protein
MKKILFILSFPSFVLFASCKKDNNHNTPSPVASYTLTTGWQKINFIDTSDIYNISFDIYNIPFINNTGFASGSNIYKSTDGRKTSGKVVALASNYFMELHFTDANHGWACGEKGTVLKFAQ